MDTQLVCQAFSLLGFIVYHSCILLISFPRILLGILRGQQSETDDNKAIFYEGKVEHERRLPIKNSFVYPVRMALLCLDDPPKWWSLQLSNHLTADAARAFAATDGKVWLLTNPVAVNYEQNPISVYYCYNEVGDLQICISEVSNTPWGERVTFLFDPKGQSVPKALHVSPFMDMKGTWILKASEPGEKLSLYVGVQHPEMGQFFDALLTARRCQGLYASSPCEKADLTTLIRYGYQPQRVALWIYWQALVLLWKGAPFFSPPCKAYRAKAAASATHPPCASGARYVWREAKGWPWRAE